MDKKLWDSIVIAVSERWPGFDEGRSSIVPFCHGDKYRGMWFNKNGKTVTLIPCTVPELPDVKLDYNNDIDTLIIDVGVIKSGAIRLYYKDKVAICNAQWGR